MRSEKYREKNVEYPFLLRMILSGPRVASSHFKMHGVKTLVMSVISQDSPVAKQENRRILHKTAIWGSQ